jgi:hypothetical protein
MKPGAFSVAIRSPFMAVFKTSSYDGFSLVLIDNKNPANAAPMSKIPCIIPLTCKSENQTLPIVMAILRSMVISPRHLEAATSALLEIDIAFESYSHGIRSE